MLSSSNSVSFNGREVSHIPFIHENCADNNQCGLQAYGEVSVRADLIFFAAIESKCVASRTGTLVSGIIGRVTLAPTRM